MTAADQDQDRNEAATPHKLAEARKQGQIARSADLVSALVFCTAVAYLCWQGMALLEAQFRFDRLLMARAGAGALHADEELTRIISESLVHGLELLMPFFIALLLGSIVASLAQTGGIFSLKPLEPDWNRLNPAKGFERVMSLRTMFDTGRALLKLTILVIIVVLVAQDLRPQFHQLAAATSGTFLRLLVADAGSAALKMACGMLAIAAVDLVFTRREFDRKMRMSRREVREESKQREGDPRIRARLRGLRQELLKRSLAVRQTRHADLLVTNPTHYAVALQYRHGSMAAPRILAKGADGMAAAMRDIAHRRGIPIVQRPSLARALYAQAEVDQALPEAFYRDVAQLMIWVIAMKRSRGAEVTP
jgi:flagellar biosynthesis protein FlhB